MTKDIRMQKKNYPAFNNYKMAALEDLWRSTKRSVGDTLDALGYANYNYWPYAAGLPIGVATGLLTPRLTETNRLTSGLLGGALGGGASALAAAYGLLGNPELSGVPAPATAKDWIKFILINSLFGAVPAAALGGARKKKKK